MGMAVVNLSKRGLSQILGLGKGVVVQVLCQPDSPYFDLIIEHPDFPEVPESGALPNTYLTTSITSCEHGGITNTTVKATFGSGSNDIELSDTKKDNEALFEAHLKEKVKHESTG